MLARTGQKIQVNMRGNNPDYSYSDIIEKGVVFEDINSVILSSSDLDKNMDTMLKLLNDGVTVKCVDFECVLFLDKLINKKINNKVILIEDGLRLPREYIDLTKINNINVTIPLTYLMWGVKFNDEVGINILKYVNPYTGEVHLSSLNGNKTISFDNYKKIQETINRLTQYNVKNNSEKIELISDYLQSRVQYISELESASKRGIFITPGFPPYIECKKKSGLIETIHNENYGLCMGISSLSTVLLNNEAFDCEVESIVGCAHAWNKVLIDGAYYYFDNTWSITRSENPHPEALITLSFQKKYLLFGSNTAEEIGHHIPETTDVYNNAPMSETDYKLTRYNPRFQYQTSPRYRSYKKI